jgi:hypothetical protein
MILLINNAINQWTLPKWVRFGRSISINIIYTGRNATVTSLDLEFKHLKYEINNSTNAEIICSWRKRGLVLATSGDFDQEK